MLQENGSSEGKKVFLPIKKNIGYQNQRWIKLSAFQLWQMQRSMFVNELRIPSKSNLNYWYFNF